MNLSNLKNWKWGGNFKPDYSSFLRGHVEYMTILSMDVHSRRMRYQKHGLQKEVYLLDVKKFLPSGCSNTGRKEVVRSLKFNWTRPWATCSDWSNFRNVLDNRTSGGPFQSAVFWSHFLSWRNARHQRFTWCKLQTISFLEELKLEKDLPIW